jgi:hypothetical protein
MLFKNPTVLYGLLFLLVPIIVHLFQLRKFKKVAFTNVAFLKPLITQTRKSRTLKKWLTLMARLLAVACLVLAFAQPYFPLEGSDSSSNDLIIYLDNSYSLQAKGEDGILYQAAVNQLIEKLPADLNFSLFTNDAVYQNVSRQEIANDLLKASYSTISLSPEQIELKAKSLINSKNKNATLVWISDFQRNGDQPFVVNDGNLNRQLIKLAPVETNNISLDSASLTINDLSEQFVEVSISSQTKIANPVTISLVNDNVLLAKTTASIKDGTGTAQFKFPVKIRQNGYLELEDEALAFDNKLFLSTNEKEPVPVLHVNDSKTDFLKRIYTSDEFDYQTTTSSQLNFNSIKDQAVIILNEVSTITVNLAGELNKFTASGGTLVIIPSLEGKGYAAISGLTNPSLINTEKRIVSINFEHPLLRNVFSERVTNFQYPKVNSVAYATAASNRILSFDDNTAFLYQYENTYIFTAPLNTDNSNFQNSPLVVPVFYKLGLKNAASGVLYQQLGQNNLVNIPVKLDQDQILELSLEEERLIPEQRAYDSFVELQTGSEIKTAGTYDVMLNTTSVATVSFNVARDENRANYYTNEELGGAPLASITEFIQDFQEDRNAMKLWKYFVAAALFFLICELLILKFIK